MRYVLILELRLDSAGMTVQLNFILLQMSLVLNAWKLLVMTQTFFVSHSVSCCWISFFTYWMFCMVFMASFSNKMSVSWMLFWTAKFFMATDSSMSPFDLPPENIMMLLLVL